MDLAQLLPLLRSHGVRSFKNAEFALTFDPQAPAPIPDQIQDVPTGEFKGDDLMNADKMLFWSASPDPSDKEELPLAGDAPIEAE